MNPIRLFIDEDAMDQRFIQAVKSRGVDIMTVRDVQTLGYSDEEQLAFASRMGRALYTFNVGDFCQLHNLYMNQQKEHTGIIISSQDYSVGEQMRRVLRLMESMDAEAIVNQLVFLSCYVESP